MSPRRRRVQVSASHDREVELKYAFDDQDAVRDLVGGESVAGLRAGPWRTVAVVDRYLDTPSRALERAGFGARIRRSDHKTLLTVKAAKRRPDESAALHERVELEGPANDRLDPRRWPASAARAVVEATVRREPLRTHFVVDQRREERDLLDIDGSIVARLSLDAGDIRRYGHRLGSFLTLEIESLDPDPGSAASTLRSLGSQLEASGLLQPEHRSKEEIGMALVRGDEPEPQVEAAPPARRVVESPPRQPGVRANDSLAEAGRKVLRMHLLRMLALEEDARAGEDIEAVHRMRVATRRMRAAWRVFDGAYKKKLQRRYVGELREVATALGGVRDMDVQLERLARYRDALLEPESIALAPLAEEWQRRREAARAVLLDLFASRGYERFVDDYLDFVETPGTGARAGRASRVRDTAGARIWTAYENVRAHEPRLQWADVAELHALRIDGKRLRYVLEFIREALPSSVERLIADVTAMQDHLGALNDAQIAADRTREWLMAAAAGIPTETGEAAGAFLEANEAEVTRLRRRFQALWRRVAGAPFRRRLAAVVGSL